MTHLTTDVMFSGQRIAILPMFYSRIKCWIYSLEALLSMGPTPSSLQRTSELDPLVLQLDRLVLQLSSNLSTSFMIPLLPSWLTWRSAECYIILRSGHNDRMGLLHTVHKHHKTSRCHQFLMVITCHN